MAERFTLQIFADTKQASAELKRFAIEQEALAARLTSKANVPGRKGYVAPKPALAQSAKTLGAGSRLTKEQEARGVISSPEAAKRQAIIAQQQAKLSATAKSTLGAEGTKLVEEQYRSGVIAAANALKKQAATVEVSNQATNADTAATAKATAARKKQAQFLNKADLALVRQLQKTADQREKFADPAFQGARTAQLREAQEQKLRERRVVRTPTSDTAEFDRLRRIADARALAEKQADTARIKATDPQVAKSQQAADTSKVEEKIRRSRENQGNREKLAGQRQLGALGERTAALKIQTGTAKGQASVFQNQLAKFRLARLKAEQNAAIRAQAAGPTTRFQRVQGKLRGQPATDQATAGQFFGGKALTTFGFAASSIALFAIVGGLTSAIKEAEELERVFNNIEFQLQATGDVARIDEVRGSIKDLARDTGLGADEIARVFFQLQGAFGGDTTRALRETASAAELVRITGLSLDETVDSFTALTQNFEEGSVSIRDIGDSALGLQERFGVLADETITFAADLAPVAEAAGFTVEELEALGASAQKFSGRSGSSLAEAFGRIIPQVQGNAADLISLFQQIPSLGGVSEDLATSLGAGDTQAVFEILIENYNNLDKAQQNQLVSLIGGRREAAALVGVLENGEGLLEEWSGATNDAGKQADRFAKFNETLNQKLAKMGEELKLLGVAIFESGFRDLFKFLIDNGGTVFGVLSDLGGAFQSFNDALGGIPGKIAAIAIALKALQAVASSNLALKIGGLGGSLIPTAAGASGAFQGLAGFGISENTRLGAAEGGTAATSNVQLFRQQGARETAKGIGQGVARNKAIFGAVGLLIGAQIVNWIADPIEEAATKRGEAAFADVDRAIERGEPIEAERQRAVDEAALSTSETVERRKFAREKFGALGDVGIKIASIFDSGQGAEDEARFESARRTAQNQLSEDLVAQYDILRNAGRFDIDEITGELEKGAVGVTVGGELVELERLNEIMAKKDADELLSPEELAILQQLGVTIEDRVENDTNFAAALADTEFAPDIDKAFSNLEEVRTRFEGGEATKAEFIVALRGAASGAQALIDAGTSTLEVTADAFEKINEYRDVVSSQLVDDMAWISKIEEYRTGRADPTADAARQLAAIKSGDLSPEDQTSTIDAYLNSLRAKVQEAADAASTDAEAARIYAEGAAVDPAATRAILIDQVAANVALTGDIGPLAAEALGGLAAFNEETVDRAIRLGITLKEARLQLLDAEIAAVQEIIDGFASLPEASTLDDYYRDIRGELVTKRRSLAGQDVNIDPLTKVTAEQAAADKEDAQKAKDLQDARFSLLEAQAGTDSVKVAQIGVQRARQAISDAQGDDTAMINAQAELIVANRALRDAELDLINARFDLAAAYAADDPVAVARIGIQKAQQQLASATSPGERIAAQIAIVEGQRAVRDTINDVYDSQFDLVAAWVANDPVEAARVGIAKANSAVQRANDAASRNRALAQRVQAQRALKDALNEVINSQVEVAIALADVAGNTVESAELALKLAVQKLRQLQQSGAGTAALNSARAGVIGAEGSVRDSILAERQEYYQFLHDMGQITTGQLIEYLQSLMSIPDLTENQVRDIQLQIKNLRDQLGQDFQFNLPTNLALPTLYEVQRVDQGGTRSSVTDNRQVEINIAVSSDVDLEALERVLAESVGTSVNGTIPRIY